MTELPYSFFLEWFNEACACRAIAEPTAMNLATTSQDGMPSNRIVLLKDHSEDGFVFFTNYESRKSRELEQNPYAALCFYWMPLDKQIRVEGTVQKVSAEISDAYFVTRERKKQIGAWASAQSHVMSSEDALVQAIEKYTKEFEGVGSIPRPPHWGGWKLIPQRYEFWQQKEYRLHDRWEFVREVSSEHGWRKNWLFP